MSGNESKDKASAQNHGDKNAEADDYLNNPDAQMDDAQLDHNEGGEFDEAKNLEEDKNQDGDNEAQDNAQDHAEGEEAGH